MHVWVAITSISFFLSIINATPEPTAAPKHFEKRGCLQDNCLRALKNRISTAVPFCSTYTTSASATIPTWATSQCASNPTRVSSACNCLATGTLTKVYGPKDNTSYAIYEQAVNIRSDPGNSPEEPYSKYLQNCWQSCVWYGSQCQTFSFAQMPIGLDGSGGPGGGFLCYVYETQFQPASVQNSANWTANVVYERL